jgi:hypothetical protein
MLDEPDVSVTIVLSLRSTTMKYSSLLFTSPNVFGTLSHGQLQAHNYVAFSKDIFSFPDLTKHVWLGT